MTGAVKMRGTIGYPNVIGKEGNWQGRKTGTDTDHEDFQRLLANVYSWKINCAIVKDLSRLSRNYIDAGNLIENLFVRFNIRFISLAEGMDSLPQPRQRFQYHCADHQCYERSIQLSDLKENSVGI